MRVMVSIDMEGVAGVATLDQTVRGGSGYPRAMELMTAEANAAIAGAFDGGATEVVVDDSHRTMDNLLHAALDRRARVVFGAPRAQCMVAGIDASVDVLLFVGYHAPAGCHGVLAHTYSSSAFAELRANGLPQSEASCNALIAAAYGVPVGLLTGDDVICALAQQKLPDAVVVEVKTAHGHTAADSLHPEEACARIRAGAAEAVRRAPRLARPTVPGGVVLEFDLHTPLHADYCAMMPTAHRISGRTVRIEVPDALHIASAVSTAYYLGSLASREMALIAQRR